MKTATEDPRLIYAPDSAPDWSQWDTQVTTIHLGQRNAKEPLDITLPPDWPAGFDKVTHLRLWGLALHELPALPEGLKWLEIRACRKLVQLRDLPAGLEVLDLGGCVALIDFPKNGIATLRRLHIDGCSQIPESRLNCFLEKCLNLEELTAEKSSQLGHLTLPTQVGRPEQKDGQLQKLVLAGCESLRSLPDLGTYPWLRHVNLNHCVSLSHLPALPVKQGDAAPPLGPGLQYFTAHNCPQLRSYGPDKLDLRPVHLSEATDHNVAPMMRTLHDLGTDPGKMVMSKLLLLGSGRCGKTTIAKALQWYEMSEDEQAANRELNPETRQTSTDSIHFWQWATAFEIEGNQQDGRAFLWDFAGQEVYHNTHRLFASQGAVFIIATTTEKEHQKRLAEELKDISQTVRDAYKTENEYRELKYWLDYLRSALGLTDPNDLGGPNSKISVLIIHTGPGTQAEVHDYLAFQAGPYANLIRTGDLPFFRYDWSGAQAGGFFEPVRIWVRRALGRSADEFGIRGPKLFQLLSEVCAEHLAENLEGQIHEPVISFADAWQPMVQKALKKRELPCQVENLPEISGQSARYLHNCGQIFWLRQRHETGGEIILDQAWSCRAIYSLCDPLHPSSLLKASGAVFDEATLRDAVAKKCRGDFTNQSQGYQNLFLDLLDKCDVCVRTGGNGWIAIQPELLPEFKEEMIEEMEREWQRVQLLNPDKYSNHSFSLFGTSEILLGNSDFRGLIAWLARNLDDRLPNVLVREDAENERSEADFGDISHGFRHQRKFSPHCRIWRNGMQIRMEWKRPLDSPDDELGPEVSLLLRVEWQNEHDESERKRQFEGGLFLQFLTPDEDRYVPRLKKLLFEGDGPLSFFKDKLEETDQRVANQGIEKWGLRGSGATTWARRKSDAPPKGTPFDIAVSYRSTDGGMVEKMCIALRKAGWRVYNYDTDLVFKPEEGGSRITEIYNYLKYAKVILVVPSNAYFEVPVYDPNEKNRNLYSPVELAEAILAWKQYSEDEKKAHGLKTDRRPESHFFWVANGAIGLSLTKISEQVGPLLTTYYSNVTLKRMPPAQEARSAPVVAIDERESVSVRAANERMVTKFLDKVGRDGKRLITIDMATPDPFSNLIQRIAEVLKRGPL